jgi:GNAT superfamily N-acetyltransferase
MNPGNLHHIYLSDIDTERFGIPIARASEVTVDTLPSIMDFCRTNGVRMVIARCAVSNISAAQEMQRLGFVLMDTLLFYRRDIVGIRIPKDDGKALIRSMRTGEEEDVRNMAAKSFVGYSGHYHSDDRLDKAKCDEAYISWAYRSCTSRDVADDVLLAELNGVLAGFGTMCMRNPEEGEGVLFGVVPSAQGQGVYRSLIIQGMNWCRKKKATRMVVSTQITNIAVQKVWVRLGFEPSHGYYTFHKWFDEF